MVMGSEEEHEYVAGTYGRESRIGWRRVSWGAIFAGLFVTLAVFVTLQILGAGIGLSVVDLTGRETTSPRSLGIGAAIWWLVIGLLSLFVGGWVAGRFGWLPNKLDRILHGLTVWAAFYAVMFWLVTTTLSTLVGGGLSALGGTVSAAGQAVVDSPQAQQTGESRGLSLETIREEIAGALGTDTSRQAQQGDEGLVSAVNEYFQGPQTPQDRRQLAQEIAQTTGMSQARANQMIENLEQRAQQAAETGEQAANITGITFIALAVAMLLGAVAAMLGGLLAPAPRYIPPREYQRARPAEATVSTYTTR